MKVPGADCARYFILRFRRRGRVRLRLFVAKAKAVSPGVQALRVGKNRRRIRRTVNNVIRSGAAWRIQPEIVPCPLGDFMIGAGSIATDAQAANDFAIFVQADSSTEENQ